MENVQSIKSDMRMDDIKYDPWGVAMSVFFDVAGELYDRMGRCPHEWEYRPGAMGPYVEEDSIYFDSIRAASDDELEYLGNLLHRYTQMLKYFGKDY